MDTSKSPQVTFPRVPPHDAVAEYKRALKFKTTDKLFPEFDLVHFNEPKPCLALLKIRLRDTEDLLAQKRQQQTTLRKHLDKQWMELDVKEKQLRENFNTFNTFVHENIEKRDRADKKITEDSAVIDQRQRDINMYIQSYVDLNQVKNEMESKIREYRLYEDFLQRVLAYSADFVSIQDMINRYLALVFAKKQLAQVQEDNFKELEIARSDMMKLVTEKNLEIVGLNNQIAGLQARYETANIKSLECESLVTRIKNNGVQVMSEIDEVKSSIWNMYEHMSISKEVPIKIPKDDVEAQILYIKRTLTELHKINHILRKRAKKAKSS